MTGFTQPFPWTGPSGDPNDEQFGHVVEPAGLEAVGAYDAVLVGEPYDGGVIGQPGARDGPAAIRRELAATKTHSFGRGPVAGIGDLGDVALPAGESVSDIQSRVREAAASVHERDVFPVFIGGDNSLTYPNVAPLLAGAKPASKSESESKSGPASVAVVSLDAHLDCREVHDHPSSGTPYRQLFGAGLDQLVVVGARDFETSTAYADYLDDRGGTIVTAGEVGADLEGSVDRARSAVDGADRVYVSVDLDVLDVTAAPAVSASTPGGLTTRELYRLLGKLGEADVCGFELVECAPPLESGSRTALAASRAIAHFLASRLDHDSAPGQTPQ